MCRWTRTDWGSIDCQTLMEISLTLMQLCIESKCLMAKKAQHCQLPASPEAELHPHHFLQTNHWSLVYELHLITAWFLCSCGSCSGGKGHGKLSTSSEPHVPDIQVHPPLHLLQPTSSSLTRGYTAKAPPEDQFFSHPASLVHPT